MIYDLSSSSQSNEILQYKAYRAAMRSLLPRNTRHKLRLSNHQMPNLMELVELENQVNPANPFQVLRVPDLFDRSPDYVPTGQSNFNIPFNSISRHLTLPIPSHPIRPNNPLLTMTVQGQVGSHDEFPQTEGYRPIAGYFSQSAPCDRIMRIWFQECAFKDAPDSYYHKSAAKLFPPGTGVEGKMLPTATYIGNMLKASEPLSQHYQ